MALKRITHDGYGQIELNQVAFRRDGRIEAQCALAADLDYVENGMLLAVDNVTRTIKMPVDGSYPIALNYTAEHMYDERLPGLKNFRVNRGEILPRLGYLATGDKFTTNCVCYDDDTYTTEEAFEAALDAIATTPLYGGISEEGAIKVSATKPTVGPALLVIKKTTMPDGQLAVKFQAL